MCVYFLAGLDYVSIEQQQLRFFSSGLPQCLSIEILSDDIVEADEQFLVFLSSSDEVVVINQPRAAVVIMDSDDSMYLMFAAHVELFCIAAVTVEFLETLYTVDEGDILRPCLLLNGAIDREVIIRISTHDVQSASGNI